MLSTRLIINRYLKIFIFFLLTIHVAIGQDFSCAEVDSNLCYILDTIVQTEFTIERKLISKDSVSSSGMLLIDINNDCIPEIITLGIDTTYSYHTRDTSWILIIETETGKIIKEIATPNVLHSEITQFTAGDVDEDGIPEIIVAISPNAKNKENHSKLFCYNADGSLKWKADDRISKENFLGFSFGGGAPQLADFNHDGIPEVYIYNRIFNAVTGKMLIDGGNNGMGIGKSYNDQFSLSIAAQIDTLSPNLELAAGYTVYDVSIVNINGMSGNELIPHTIERNGRLKDGYSSVADLDNDGELEVIIAAFGINYGAELYVYNYRNNTIIFKAATIDRPNGGTGWIPPIISDLDGSNELSILTAINDSLQILKYDGSTLLKSEYKESYYFSNFFNTEFAVFDFDNDGIMEIVSRPSYLSDSISISNYRNKQMHKIESFYCKGAYRTKFLIGSIQNHSESNLCVTCEGETIQLENGIIAFPYIHLFGGKKDSSWVPSRAIWNQRNYHGFNINDDGTIPQVMKNNATYKDGEYNSFNVQHPKINKNREYLIPVANVYASIGCTSIDLETGLYSVKFNIYNDSLASLGIPTNLPISFYNGDPELDGILIGTYFTTSEISKGGNLSDLTFSFSSSYMGPIYMVVNTDRLDSGDFENEDFFVPDCDIGDNILIISFPEIQNEKISFCEGKVYDFFGANISSEGIYYYRLVGNDQCDSVLFILEAEILDTSFSSSIIMACDSFFWQGNIYYEEGIYSKSEVNEFGCDSVLYLDLKLSPSSVVFQYSSSCDSFLWNGTYLKESNIYSDVYTNSYGCDSTISLDLTILNSSYSSDTVFNCEQFMWNEVLYTESGNYMYHLSNALGCDSTAILELTISDEISVQIEESVCEFFIWNETTYTESGTYTSQATSLEGCDSMTTLQLTVHYEQQIIEDIEACDYYFWNGVTYNESGVYENDSLTEYECDSTTTLNLIINKSTSENIVHSTCDQYMWNGVLYTESGHYVYDTINAFGCDSIANLNLTIGVTSESFTSLEVCDSISWNGELYTAGGMYEAILINSHGCDSISKLDLMIYNSSLSNVNEYACDSIYIFNQTFDQDGIYTINLFGEGGCDSIIIFELELESNLKSEMVFECNNYEWDVNGVNYENSGIYRDTFLNEQGCDSIHVLELFINDSYLDKIIAFNCGSYIWELNGELIDESGSYSYELLTEDGCDSIIILDITIDPIFHKVDSIIANNRYLWKVNEKKYFESGIYPEMLTSNDGCDSLHILVLEIQEGEEIYYPNVIGLQKQNQYFTIYGSSIQEVLDLSIYDRWGNKIASYQNFIPNEPVLGWDGTFKNKYVEPGVYVWISRILMNDGIEVLKSGDVLFIL